MVSSITSRALRLLEHLPGESLLSAWHPFRLHTQLGRALYAKKFTSPTPIQAQALPLALKGKDLVGVAETVRPQRHSLSIFVSHSVQGSGKTLAYGLPILHQLLTQAYSRPIPKSHTRRPVRALILAPTRELALQVSSHLNACLNDVPIEAPDEEETTTKNKGKARATTEAVDDKPRHPPLVYVAAIVGGMSAQKQRRILSRGIDVLVATPGRLWDLLQEVGFEIFHVHDRAKF